MEKLLFLTWWILMDLFLIFKEMESRVEAIWEKMNKGVSNKTAKSFSNKRNVSTVNASSKKANNVRMFSLSLALLNGFLVV